MSDTPHSMWHCHDARIELDGDSRLMPRALRDPLLLVFSGPGGLPYSVRVFVTAQFRRFRGAAALLRAQRTAG